MVSRVRFHGHGGFLVGHFTDDLPALPGGRQRGVRQGRIDDPTARGSPGRPFATACVKCPVDRTFRTSDCHGDARAVGLTRRQGVAELGPW